jgi:dTDP-4-dehydrorhamnose 3,5-epimerase
VKFTPVPIRGVWLIDPEPVADDRGFFARTWCADELAAHGLEARIAQCSTSFNRRRGILRGMHYQADPHGEVKIVRCTRGAIWDVALDLRPDSPTFKRWFGAELTAGNRRALYIPRGFAHGLQTLADDTEVAYMISDPYVAEAGRGVRWNDAAFGIEWPIADPILSPRDAGYPDFTA